MPQQQQDSVKVVTTLGTRFYPIGTRVYASAGGSDLYFNEQVSDVAANTMILWRNEHIDAKLEDILPYLSQSPRYQRAEETVFATNSNGQKIPQFRIQLIKALAAKKVGSTDPREDLEQKIMRENGQDFTHTQYAEMRDYLHRELQRAAKGDSELTRSPYTIMEWLHGETVCVTNPELLRIIAEVAGSSTITDWYLGAGKTGKDSVGFWREYKFYTTLRQGVTRYLTKKKGELKTKVAESGKGSDGEHKNGSFDMTPEIQLVLNQFMEQIDEEFSLARVLEVERVPFKIAGSVNGTEKPSLNLADGAYVGSPTGDMRTVSLEDVLTETNLLDGAVSFALMHYFDGILSGKYKASKDNKANKIVKAAIATVQRNDYFVRLQIASYLVLNALKELGLTDLPVAENPEIAHGVGFNLSAPGAPENFFQLLRDFIVKELTDQIVTGGLDDALGIPRFSFYNALKHMSHLEHSLPAVYNEFRVLEMNANRRVDVAQLDRRQKRDMKLQLANLEKALRVRYGYDANGYDRQKAFFIPSFLYNSWVANVTMVHEEVLKGGKRTLTPEEEKGMFAKIKGIREGLAKSTQRILDPDYVRTQEPMVNAYTLLREHFFTSQHVFEGLQKHGLAALYRFIPQANFAFEENPVKPEDVEAASVKTQGIIRG